MPTPIPVTPAGYRPGTDAENRALIAAAADPNDLAAVRFAQAVVPYARRAVTQPDSESAVLAWERGIATIARANNLPLPVAKEIALFVWAKIKGGA